MGQRAKSMHPQTWYVFTGGQRYGPYPRDKVLGWIRDGRFGTDAQFSCGADWMDVAEAIARMTGSQPEEIVLEAVPDEEVLELEPAAEAANVGASHAAGAGVPPALLQSLAPTTNVPAADSPEGSGQAEPVATVPRRDRIVVIGRRASGKTIYLATLYKHLWKSRDGMTMKALSGQVHKELMDICETLRRGEWPAATLKTTLAHMEVEITYRGSTSTLVGLDYAGEVFRDAFVNDDSESPEAKALIDHIDRAAAVILLVDPSVAVGGDSDAFVDDDFGVVQAIRRIRDWPDGDKVPIALVLTKADQNLALFKGKGAGRDFVAEHYPALVRTLGRSRFFHASAVQAHKDAKGLLRPKADSVPVNVVEPLKYCLAVLQQHEQKEQEEAELQARQQAMLEYAQAQEAAQQHRQRMFALFIIGLITLGVCIMGLIIAFHL